ncbi:transcriptional regulator, MarR family [Novosphingobium nitrogenifigens DSM 19370]|uniref:Transcriptional regulator, MarR family n=2 Tax=Novosphingobium nitrogenifigens TaxID=378548 RepID=F1ZAN4_9SPHN|nr:transcriptional regulator, MarR family [Novosphingobium nitrogenifigens DSM 19370]
MHRHRPELLPAPSRRIIMGMTKPAAITLLAWDRLLDAGARAMRAARRELKRAGLPPLEWYDILAAIDRRGPGRPRDLQAYLGIEQYNLSRLLSRMERAGLVTIMPCPGDARGQIVDLTPAGREQRAAMWPAYSTAIHHTMESRLDSDERIQLAGMLEKVA